MTAAGWGKKKVCDYDCFRCPYADCIRDDESASEIDAAEKRDKEARKENGPVGSVAAEIRRLKRNASRRAYVERNREKVRAYNREYAKKNKDKMRAADARYKERQKEKRRQEKGKG